MLTLHNGCDTPSHIGGVGLTSGRLFHGYHKIWNDMHGDLSISLYQSDEEFKERLESSPRYKGRICNDVKLRKKGTFDFGEGGGGRQFQKQSNDTERLGEESEIRRRKISLNLRNEVRGEVWGDPRCVASTLSQVTLKNIYIVTHLLRRASSAKKTSAFPSLPLFFNKLISHSMILLTQSSPTWTSLATFLTTLTALSVFPNDLHM
jgi:hypothetical protein